MASNKKRLAVFLGQEKFGIPGVEERKGNEHDVLELKSTLKKLGFSVRPFKDLKRQEILNALTTAHGQNGKINFLSLLTEVNNKVTTTAERDGRSQTSTFTSFLRQPLILNYFKILPIFVNDIEVIYGLSRITDFKKVGCLTVIVLAEICGVAITGYCEKLLVKFSTFSIQPNAVWSQFTVSRCKELMGKPKLFFFCDLLDRTDHPEERSFENVGSVNNHSDFIWTYCFGERMFEELTFALCNSIEEITHLLTTAMRKSESTSSTGGRISHFESTLRFQFYYRSLPQEMTSLKCQEALLPKEIESHVKVETSGGIPIEPVAGSSKYPDNSRTIVRHSRRNLGSPPERPQRSASSNGLAVASVPPFGSKPFTLNQQGRSCNWSTMRNSRDKDSYWKLTKADISMPQHFLHVFHMGLDPIKGFYLNDDEAPMPNGIFVKNSLKCTVNASTQKSPFELLKGYRPRFYDGMFAVIEHRYNSEWGDPSQLPAEGRQEILKSQEEMKQLFNQHLGGKLIHLRWMKTQTLIQNKPRSEKSSISQIQSLEPSIAGGSEINCIDQATQEFIFDLISKKYGTKAVMDSIIQDLNQAVVSAQTQTGTPSPVLALSASLPSAAKLACSTGKLRNAPLPPSSRIQATPPALVGSAAPPLPSPRPRPHSRPPPPPPLSRTQSTTAVPALPPSRKQPPTKPPTQQEAAPMAPHLSKMLPPPDKIPVTRPPSAMPARERYPRRSLLDLQTCHFLLKGAVIELKSECRLKV
ncbi:hypothetical protein B566_EDAN014337 [Ephemera danica]|nr:hypothetical protein B566_EDAN014337 [Ephemera danica]